jgi:hypothetical protein
MTKLKTEGTKIGTVFKKMLIDCRLEVNNQNLFLKTKFSLKYFLDVIIF